DAFKGKGLVSDAVTIQPAFLLAVSLGAALTVLLATYIGMPISTTHSLTRALVGAGLLAAPREVNFSSLGTAFVLPLLCSPLVSMILTVLVYPLFRLGRRLFGVTSTSCLCIGSTFQEVKQQLDGSLMLVSTGATVAVWQANDCYERYQGRVLGLEAGWLLDGLHYLSGGAVGFARGLNDTPKIVALLIAGEAISPGT